MERERSSEKVLDREIHRVSEGERVREREKGFWRLQEHNLKS